MTNDKPSIHQRTLGGGLRKHEILRGYSSFRTVLRSGNRFDGRIIRCTYLKNLHLNAGWHFGVSVSSRSHNAVQRNRIKRLFREAIVGQRQTWELSTVDLSLVLEPIRGAPRRLRLAEVEADVERIFTMLMNKFSDQ